MEIGHIHKVLLIFPPAKIAEHSHKPCVPPLGILYCAAVLRDAGYEVDVLDAIIEDYYHVESAGKNFIWYGLPFGEIEKKIKEIDPDVVGISCPFSSSFTAVRETCKRVKAFNEKIVTITGGTHPSFLAEKCLNDLPELDFIIIGEGEYAIRELLNRLNSDEDVSKIDGLAYRKDGKFYLNPKTRFIEDLDELPLPARDLVPINKYIGINSPHGITSKEAENISIMTSRGCPFACIFCSSAAFWGRKYRARSAENVLNEMEFLVKEYGIKEIQFLDDNLTLNKERAIKIFQGIIDRGLKIAWNTPNGVAIWTLDEEILTLMKKSGCYALTLAVESGDQHVLKHIIKKPLDLEDVRKVVKITRKLGIQTHAFFVLGFPEESPEEIANTFRFAREMDFDSASFNLAQPLPGSELDSIVREKRYIRDDFDYENIAYLLSSYDTPYFKGKELERTVAKEFLKFNISLAYRHPLIFMRKFGKYMLKNPVYSIQFLLGFLKKTKKL